MYVSIQNLTPHDNLAVYKALKRQRKYERRRQKQYQDYLAQKENDQRVLATPVRFIYGVFARASINVSHRYDIKADLVPYATGAWNDRSKFGFDEFDL